MKDIYIVLALSVTACDNTVSGVQQDTNKLVSSAKEQAHSISQEVASASAESSKELREFRRSSAAELTRLSNKIELLQTKAVDSTERETRQTVASLKARHNELTILLEQLSDTTEGKLRRNKAAWSEKLAELGREVDRSLDQLGDSVMSVTETTSAQ